MSEYAEHHRKAMKDKAHRMVGADPHTKVDSSDWTPPEAEMGNVQTGERPVSPRQYKRGGHVERKHKAVERVLGEHVHKRMDRKPRKSGGRALTADSYINRDVREANEEREGPKHVGGFKRGGRAHKADGGSFVPTERMAFQGGPSQMSKAAGLKMGGSAHPDEAEDRKLVKKMVKKPALTGKRGGGSVSDGELEGTRPEKGGRMAHKHGGRADAHWIKGAIKHPGALHRELNVADDKRIPEKKLKKAEHSKNKLVAKRAHLADTLEHMHKGREHHASGGKAGKTNVNIVIAAPDQGGGQGPMAEGAPMMPPQMPKPMGPPPAQLGGTPLPPQQPPPQNGPVLGMPPGMPRKRGGRASYPDMEYGAGSGEGRLEKIREYGHRA